MMMICEKIQTKLEPLAFTLLRVTVGIIMATHGWLKYSDIETWKGQLTSLGVPHPEINAWLSIAGELLGGLGLIVGLLTPLAAFGIVAVMAVAISTVHFSNGLLAKNNGFEYPLTLLVVGLYFMVKGGGCISLDAILKKKCSKCSDTPSEI
jgi:putative oxidoreductase